MYTQWFAISVLTAKMTLMQAARTLSQAAVWRILRRKLLKRILQPFFQDNPGEPVPENDQSH